LDVTTARRQAIVNTIVERTVSDATGSNIPPLVRWTGPEPAKRYWLGWLMPESEVATALPSPGFVQRFRPASQGMSFRVRALPVTLDIQVSFAVWPVLHPGYAEQIAGSGLEEADDDDARPVPGATGPDRREPLARVRTKVPTGMISLPDIEIAEPRDRTVGREEIATALARVLQLPSSLMPYRPARLRGNARPLASDLLDEHSWEAWVASNLDEPVLPSWRVDVDVETRALSDGTFELTVLAVNRTPDAEHQFVDRDQTRAFPGWACDPNVYEVELGCRPDSAFVPYTLEQIPRSYRYDRNVGAFGLNCAVESTGDRLSTAFAAVAETDRVYPRTHASDGSSIDTSFLTLAGDTALDALDRLVREARAWTASHWSARALDILAAERDWTEASRAEAASDSAAAETELEWVEAGIRTLREDPKILRAFQLMNTAMALVGGEQYDSWRPFQLAFIVGCLPATAEPASDRTVDILWFATGGGKTEAYLGLNLVHLYYGRLCGLTAGTRAWARFPLRLLSLQQTQRFAQSVLLAEVVRRENADVAQGEPFGVGYYTGSGNTPNTISLPGDRFYSGWDPSDPNRLEGCRVVEMCPACRKPPPIRFDAVTHTLLHECRTQGCPLEGPLPVWVIDDDIYRHLPSVIVGTVDKLAQIGQSRDFRKLMGGAMARCPVHGYARGTRFCDRFGCHEVLAPVPSGMSGIQLEIQDELHLLSESLGALDGNYETLFHAISSALGTPCLRIIAATATVEGYREQSNHLYRRQPRRFPASGPTKEESFWALEQSGDPLRTYVAMLPRGTTLLNAAYFVAESHRRALREILEDPNAFCLRQGLPIEVSDAVAADVSDVYEVLVAYALRKQDLDRFATDVCENHELCPTAEAYDSVTGDRDFWNVREVLDRLERPPADESRRIKILGATSAISHGVDVARLNAMVVMGMPTSTSEFIQSTARVGRTLPGVVFALINPMRERDVSHFRYFRKYAEYLDRLVERVPVNRESLPVLRRVLPGGLMAWLLQYYEPEWLFPGGVPAARTRERLWYTKGVAQALDAGLFDQPALIEHLRESFDVDPHDPRFDLHRATIEQFVARTVAQVLVRRSAGSAINEELEPSPPRSLRDTESTIEIRGETR